ncbi:hypothetical protein AQUCO_05000003v1 [Aquilegia coerulea]|uniref:Small G protein signalling modulator 1/2 Rab-binding domain-containing protein n=1 Tax=Aquilegia coerulea TaxID=218851 RepID=A0A2G5CJ52_AQUCA|nr:hypothetical protein AQUCO_05000003v1 [Aquilegia coerulea]
MLELEETMIEGFDSQIQALSCHDIIQNWLRELKSMSRINSGKRSGDYEPDGTEIVFVKDNVTIHPREYASERISGRLRLIKHGALLFMTWIPYKEKTDSTVSSSSANTKLSESSKLHTQTLSLSLSSF